MQDPHSSSNSQHPAHLDDASVWVQRALFEVRSGRCVVVEDDQHNRILILAAEQASPSRLHHMAQHAQGDMALAFTSMRAKALGLTCPKNCEVVIQALPPSPSPEWLHQCADPVLEAPRTTHLDPAVTPGHTDLSHAAIVLLKLAHVLPTAVFAALPDQDDASFETWRHDQNLFCVQAHHVISAESFASETLIRVSEAPVPLEDAENAYVIAYRPEFGGLEHLAIVIGNPQQSEKTPLVRIHSQCFTGDLLGSLRCDCGDQLRGAIRAIAEDGAGVLLYLAQEGRGIGLVNKLKAYVLQDQGTDTLEANEKLGFHADERVYAPAAMMLKDLGLTKIRLLTNNPSKLSALKEANIEVCERVTHAFPSNQHNETYLHTKKTKGGHLL